MKKAAILLLVMTCFACSKTETATSTDTSSATKSDKLEIKSDVAQRIAKLPKTVIDYDHSLLNAEEQQVVAKLIEASKHIDEIYWLQVDEDSPALLDRLAKQAAGGGPLDHAGHEYFVASKGKWDRLAKDEPFIAPFDPKPEGAAFYPKDMKKEELEKFIADHPDQKAAVEGLFTVIRRDASTNALKAIPYSVYYKEHLDQAAAKLREAAALTTNASLKDYLTKLADAFGKDNYRESDIAWMDLQGPIEVVIGPYEVYEDEMFNYKAAFESFITVVDKPESDKLTVYAKHLPDMEMNLPEPAEYKNKNRGTDSPIRVVQEIFTAGDARRGVQTSAFNLPNDEVVREQKGSKKVLLKNVMDAKYRMSGAPIAQKLVEPSQLPLLSFDAYFNHVLFHELSHGVGPGLIPNPANKAERVDTRTLLKNLYSAIEECKADVLGQWNMLYARDKGFLASSFDEKQQWVTYAGLMFRSMRFGIDEAHGRGTAVQWNWMREKGAIVPATNGTFSVDFAKARPALQSLATELLTIEATGDFARAEALLNKYGVSNAEIDNTIKGLPADIPVDITPVFPAAGEK